MFGGMTKETKNGGGSTNDLFSFDLTKNYWQFIKAKPKDGDRRNLPIPREEHTAVLYEDYIVIFGGFVGGEGAWEEAGHRVKRTNEMFSYSTADNTWERLKVKGKKPCPRSGHSAVQRIKHQGEFQWQEQMFVFGGKNGTDAKLNDLWQFDFARKSGTWTEIKADNPPPPRSGHSASIYKDRYMVIFGGIAEVTKELNDMYLFDFNEEKWICLFRPLPSPQKLKSYDNRNASTITDYMMKSFETGSN